VVVVGVGGGGITVRSVALVRKPRGLTAMIPYDIYWA
jgi:hypothetical protein